MEKEEIELATINRLPTSRSLLKNFWTSALMLIRLYSAAAVSAGRF